MINDEMMKQDSFTVKEDEVRNQKGDNHIQHYDEANRFWEGSGFGWSGNPSGLGGGFASSWGGACGSPGGCKKNRRKRQRRVCNTVIREQSEL